MHAVGKPHFSKSARSGPPAWCNIQPVTCEYLLSNGERCKRTVAAHQRFCWQHVHGWRAKYRSLTRSESVVFWLAVVSLAATVWFGVTTATEPTGFLEPQDIEALSPGFVFGKPLHLDISLVNKGAAPVFRVRFFAAVIVLSDVHGTDSELLASAKEKFNIGLQNSHRESQLTHQEGAEVGVGDVVSHHMEYALSEPQVKGLATGNTRIYVLVWARWDKHRNWRLWPDEVTNCVWLRPFNSTGNTIVWANCS
jgi:hypothetical protein